MTHLQLPTLVLLGEQINTAVILLAKWGNALTAQFADQGGNGITVAHDQDIAGFVMQDCDELIQLTRIITH